MRNNRDERAGPHINPARIADTPEEILLVLDGEVGVEIEGKESALGPGGLALIPSMAPHRFWNAGSTTAKIVGFFSSNAVIAEFEEPVQPLGSTTVGSPTPEMVR